jgi:hypothetical protein
MFAHDAKADVDLYRRFKGDGRRPGTLEHLLAVRLLLPHQFTDLPHSMITHRFTTSTPRLARQPKISPQQTITPRPPPTQTTTSPLPQLTQSNPPHHLTTVSPCPHQHPHLADCSRSTPALPARHSIRPTAIPPLDQRHIRRRNARRWSHRDPYRPQLHHHQTECLILGWHGRARMVRQLTTTIQIQERLALPFLLHHRRQQIASPHPAPLPLSTLPLLPPLFLAHPPIPPHTSRNPPHATSTEPRLPPRSIQKATPPSQLLVPQTPFPSDLTQEKKPSEDRESSRIGTLLLSQRAFPCWR